MQKDHHFTSVLGESSKLRQVNWGLSCKSNKVSAIVFCFEEKKIKKKTSKAFNPILVEVTGSFSKTFVVYKLTLITIVRNEQK